MYGILIIIFLALLSSFFAFAEISLAASRRLKLKGMVEKGDARASQIIAFQEQPGLYFTTVQIGLNAIAILAGIVGESLLSPHFMDLLPLSLSLSVRTKIASILPFLAVTMFFVLFADLIPKRIAMAMPEKVALRVIDKMRRVILLMAPLAWAFNALSGLICKWLGMPDMRKEDITPDDLYAMMEAGTMAGLLRAQEKILIDNVFELDIRMVPSAMTTRDDVVFFRMDEKEESIREKIVASPHSTYVICKDDIDHVVGYVDSKLLLERVLKGHDLLLQDGPAIRPPLIIPDTLTLAEAMDQFKGKGETLAVVLNEYGLLVGIITLQDIMRMLMGDLVGEEQQIMKRDDDSWLVDGVTPIEDIMEVFSIDEFPEPMSYETVGGFVIYTLRRIPHRTDFVIHGGYKFEVVDIDNYKIDQVLVTRLPVQGEPGKGKNPDVAESGNPLCQTGEEI